MAINLKNSVTGTGKNLVTNPILKSSATNPVNIGVKTPVNQYKTEDPRYANKTQVNTQVKTPVQTQQNQYMSVNPKYQTNQTTVPVQTNTNQSRFIGFQNNNLGVQSKFTQDMQNITQGKTNLTDLIKARTENNKNKKYLEIPTQAKAIKQYNQDQEQRYRTNEKAIEDFHYDVLKFNGKMTADQISQYYPEFRGKENQALELQKALLPYVLDNEFASMEAITQNFPDLLPAKQQANTTEDEAKATAKKIDSENKKHFDRIKNINQNTLSYNGKEFANFMIELSDVPYQVRKNYKVDSAVTDEEIIAYVLNNFPEYKEEYERIQNLQLSDQDKARLGIGGNWLNKFSVGVANAVNAANNWYQNNVQKPLSDVPIVSSIANIPGGAIGGFNKMLQAGGELTNGEFESAGQIASSGIKAIGGGVESVFNTALAPITAAFNVAGETELGKQVEENTLGLAQNGITAFYEKTPIIKNFYNSLDDEAKADLVNETMLALFHGLGKGIKKTGLDVKAGVATDAITNALQRGKYASKFQIWVEKGLADENGKFSDGALKRIVGEGTKEVESALKENFSRFNEVVEARKQARDFKQAPVDNTNLEDQRSTTEKVKSEINKATDIVKEKASEVGNEIKEKATEIKNKITTKKEVKPVEETESQGIIDKISDYGAKKITGTVSAQDKLYKAQEPRMNVLSNRRNLEQRRANSDRANELIVENGYTPTDTTTRLKAHEDTMRNIWSEIESRINKSDLLVDKTALSDVLDEYIAEQEKLGSTLNQKEINALRQEAQLLRGKITDLMTLEKQKQLYNSVINNWGDQKVSDTLANGLRRVTKEIGRLEDIILGKVPGEFTQLKKDFGALKDTYEDVFKADMKNQRKKGLGLTETYSRIEGFGDLIEGVFGLLGGNGAKALKGAGKILLGKSLAKASNNDFLIKEGFKELSDKIKAKGGDKPDNTPPKKSNTPPKKPNDGGNEPKNNEPKNKVTSKKPGDNNRLEYKEKQKEEPKKEDTSKKAPKTNTSEEREQKTEKTAHEKEHEKELTARQQEDLKNMPETEDVEAMDAKKTGLAEKLNNTAIDINSSDFKEWFGDYEKDPKNASKVVDKEGKPMMVYHGTPYKEQINVFDKNRAGKTQSADFKGIFFTDEKGIADVFSHEQLPGRSSFFVKLGEKGRVYSSYLNMRNPLDFNQKITKEFAEELYNYRKIEPQYGGGVLDYYPGAEGKEKFINQVMKSHPQSIKFLLDMNKVEEAGYDGYIAKMYGGDTPGNEYVVWDGNQIITDNTEVIEKPKNLVTNPPKEEPKKVETRNNVTKKEKAPSTKNKPIQPTVNKSIENIDDFKREIIDKRDTNMKVAMLNRMKSDIDYIVNNNLGEGGYKFLRATGNPEKHIEYMKALYDSIPENERPDINIKDYANKLGVNLKESESKNTGGIKRQTGDSRAAKFTNTIMDIIESNGGLKDGYLKVKRDALEPLYIEDIGGGKIAIGQTYIQEGDVMFDPEIVFGLDENGRLQAETFRNDSMGIYEQPIKSNDPFLETWEATLKDFIKKDIKNEEKVLKSDKNRNIIGQNNALTTKSINNGGKELQTTNGGASQGLQGENGQVSRIKTASGEQMNDSKGDSGIMRKDQPDNESIFKGQSAGPAIGGVSKNLTRSEARAINQSSKDILSKHDYSTNPSDYTKEELETLRKYEGAGGLTNKGEDTTGVLDQFYTPQTAIDAVWNLVDKYKNGKDNYTVLEPTVGTGRFIRDRKNEKYEGHEIDKTPGTIAQLLHPNADIHIGDFENQFMDFTGRRPQDFGRRVDIVVGNPPYSNRQTPQQKNGLEPKIKRSEEFFIKKGIDILNDGGTLAMVVPSTFLSNPMDYAKGEILKQATLVDAYRLPEGVFPYTNVGTDIIVFKKDNNGSSSISDNKWFEEHPEKVLGEVKERINRYGNLEKYVDGGDRPLDKLNLIYEDPTTTGITPEKQAENYAPITTIESTPVKEKPQTMNNITGGEKTKVTSTQKKRRTSKASKIDNQTIIKGDKSDLSDSVFGNGESNPKLLEYARFTNVDGYVDIKSWRGKAAEFVKTDPENLNYYKGQAYTNDLYFAGDIYEKLEQLEKDYNLTEKGTITPEQYKKQKEGLEAVLPEPYTISNPPFVSPLDQNIMNIETSEIGNVWDSKQLKYVDKNLPLRDVFLEWFRNNVSGSTMNKGLAREYLNGESMRSGSSRKGSLSDEEEKARKRHEKSVVMEQTNKIFNDWVWTKLDKDTQKKILDKFNRENRSYVVPKYGDMPLSTHNISKTFMGDKFEPKNGQIEGINFLLSKGAGIVAHGVGHGKTIEGVISTREAQLRGWNKRPLIVAPGPTLYAQRARTIKELYPDREIVNLGGLTTADIARLRNELGPDPRDWIKDGQVAIISMNGFGDNIEFRPSTQIMLEQKLKDVMETKDMNVRQEESMKKKIEKILAPGKGKDSAKHTYSFNGDFMREMYDSLFTRSHDEFIKHFTEQAKEERAKIPGGESITDDMINIDAEALWLEKPILLEDLGIDHLTVDEMHNFKNVFTSAKMNEKENGKKEVNRYGGIIQGNSSARGRKMFLATQYVMEKNNNRNVFGFTATPFNNQPIEIYNMLSFVGKNELEKMGVTNINDFFSRFAEFKEGLAPKASGTELEYKFIMKNFANARDLQRLITQFVNYKGDSTELIKPEKKLRTPILKMSDLQEEVQQEMELLALNKDNKGDILKATNGMISNLVSPFIVSGVRAPYGWEDFLDNSPKLKYFADVLKELRDSGKQDGMFIYMPVGQEFHELYREALANYTNTPKEKIGIIDSKTSSKKDEIAEKFRSGEFNVLIGGKNTAEGIDLQNNGYITAIASVDWNPTVRTQVDGRVRRQGNFNNEVLSLVPLVENSADVIFMGKADQKGSRINNELEEMLFGGDGDLSPEEMMMSLMTRPDKKAKTQINIEKQDVDKEIYGINTQKDRLEEIKRKVVDAQNNVDEIQKKIESSKQSGYSWEIPSLKDKLKNTVKAQDRLKNYVEKNGEVPSIEEIDKDIAELVKQVEGLEERKSELDNAENNGILDNLIKDITIEQQENAKNVKTYQQYIEDIKEDIKNAKRFGSKKELKEYLENKRNLLSNGKNKVTSK